MTEKASILVVDDRPDNLLAVEAVLGDLGHNIVRASSGEEALRKLLREDFAVILLDVKMPSMDGFETAALIRQRQRSRHTPIIFLTAVEKGEDQIQKGYELGATDYLMLPVSPDVLRWKVNLFIDLHLQSQERQHLAAIEMLNRELNKMFARVQELYAISRGIGQSKNSGEILEVLCSFLRQASAGALIIFDHPWENAPPQAATIEAFWQRPSDQDAPLPDITGDRYGIEEVGLASLVAPDEPVVVFDVRIDPRLNHAARAFAAHIQARSCITFPLIARGLFLGFFAAFWRTPYIASMEEDIRHIQGVVDQAAAAVYNLLLLRAEGEARRAAESADALKLKFLAMISHELRTPLASIMGFASTLLQPDVVWSQDEARDFLHIISQEALNLANLVEQLLDVSRLEAGMLQIDPQPESLHSVLAHAMPQLTTLCARHDLRLDVPDDLPAMMLDRQRIAQVFTNLVGNACNYAPPKSAITLSACARDGVVEVSVHDDGPGIPETDRDKVFEAFRQASNQAMQVKGVGLGLTIVKGIVEAHGGSVWIEESSNTGTTISLTLPVVKR